MNRRKRIKIGSILSQSACILIITAGCGRNLPQLDAAALAAKTSVLVIASPSLSEAEETEIRNAAYAESKERKFAVEWIGKAGMTEELSERIRTTPFTGVIVAGDELLPKAVETARSNPDKRFVLLADRLSKSAVADAPANVLVRSVDDTQIAAVWDEWVAQQKAAGQNVLWVTASSTPIPSSWAPSEESDQVLQKDLFPGDSWFPQLSYQAQALRASWIALNTPLESGELAKVKTLRIPIIDLQNGLKNTFNWQPIVQKAAAAILDPAWSGGSRSYGNDELVLERK